VEVGGRRTNEAEAVVVRRVFRQYVADQLPRAIALSLNGIAGARGRGWGASTINGNASRGTGNLNNRIYVGKLVWNKLRYVKDPDTRKRRSKANKARVAASLTLISQALEAIRGLIDKIVLTPAEGVLRVDLHGEAAAILQLSVASKKGRFQLGENAEELAMVAGLGGPLRVRYSKQHRDQRRDGTACHDRPTPSLHLQLICLACSDAAAVDDRPTRARSELR
jgi:hypothetical protein